MALGKVFPLLTFYISIYTENYIYENGSLAFFSHPEGYVTKENSAFKYVYQYKDHLGNVRLSYTNTGTTSVPELVIIEENNYYPFGLQHKGYNGQTSSLGSSVAQKWKYNGIEYNESLGASLYEMDLRQYDPAIARWISIDPIVHHSMSPYNAFDNNPIYWSDPSGADSWKYIGNGLYRNRQTGEETTDWRQAVNETQEHFGDGGKKPSFKINVNNSESINGPYVRLAGKVAFGIQFREGRKLFGVGEKLDIGWEKTLIDAELLWSENTGFILNVTLPKNLQNFIKSEHEFIMGYSNMGLGGEVSGTFKNGKVTSIEGTVHEGPFTLNFADGNGNMGIDILSGSTTYKMLSFTGSLSIEGVKMNVAEGTGINGLGTSKNQMDAYVKMRMHDLQESRKSNLLNKTLRDIKRLK